MAITLKDLELLKDAGKIVGFNLTGKEKKPAKRKSKYGNTKVIEGGKTFDSKKEYREWKKLLLRQKRGEIGQLAHHVVYKLIVNGELVARYEADFVYIEAATGETKVVDVKSAATRINRVYLLKKKLMKSIHNIEITEV